MLFSLIFSFFKRTSKYDGSVKKQRKCLLQHITRRGAQLLDLKWPLASVALPPGGDCTPPISHLSCPPQPGQGVDVLGRTQQDGTKAAFPAPATR